jgi:hypothetical protein
MTPNNMLAASINQKSTKQIQHHTIILQVHSSCHQQSSPPDSLIPLTSKVK